MSKRESLIIEVKAEKPLVYSVSAAGLGVSLFFIFEGFQGRHDWDMIGGGFAMLFFVLSLVLVARNRLAVTFFEDEIRIERVSIFGSRQIQRPYQDIASVAKSDLLADLVILFKDGSVIKISQTFVVTSPEALELPEMNEQFSNQVLRKIEAVRRIIESRIKASLDGADRF